MSEAFKTVANYQRILFVEVESKGSARADVVLFCIQLPSLIMIIIMIMITVAMSCDYKAIAINHDQAVIIFIIFYTLAAPNKARKELCDIREVIV